MTDAVIETGETPAAETATDTTLLTGEQTTDTPAETTDETTTETASIEYTDFVVPEGITLDDGLMGEFKDVAKGLKLNQEQAQALTDLGVKQAQTILGKIAEQQAAERNSWLEATKADKEFGGEKLGENLAIAKKALDAFATPELKAVLDSTGLGNHPELIRAMVKAGRAISEDKLVPGTKAPEGSKSAQDILYPNQNK